jgi:hypothetical protein
LNGRFIAAAAKGVGAAELAARRTRSAAQRTLTSELEARIATYEVAFRMQMEAPQFMDLSGESEATRKVYGLDDLVAAPPNGGLTAMRNNG